MTREEDVIVRVVSRHAVRDQAMLIDKLRQAGVTMTQATLSRRLRHLGVAKVGGVYRMAPTGSSSSPVRDVRRAPPNLLVIHTLPGHAGSVAARIDSYGKEGDSSAAANDAFKSVIGTVAGDDTVLVAVDSRQLHRVRQTLMTLPWGGAPLQ
ncbi:MAG: arginine repressor [Myxococcota bacterium]